MRFGAPVPLLKQKPACGLWWHNQLKAWWVDLCLHLSASVCLTSLSKSPDGGRVLMAAPPGQLETRRTVGNAAADLGDLLACGATLALRHRCHSYLVCWETLILRVTLYLGIIPFHPPGTQEVITWSGGLLYLDLWICGSYVKVLPPHSGSTTYMPYDLRRQMWFLCALTSSAKQGELQNLCYWAVTAHVWELWMVLCTVWNTVSAVYITVIKWI